MIGIGRQRAVDQRHRALERFLVAVEAREHVLAHLHVEALGARAARLLASLRHAAATAAVPRGSAIMSR